MSSPSEYQALTLPDDLTIGFSVVMPSFNQAQFISDSLDSILNQNYNNVEIIVMDGGSTDGTIDILKSYGNKIYWQSEKDNGQSDALEKGFKLATKEWYTWLNSDDLQTNNALSNVAEVIKRNPGVQVIIGQGHYSDEAGKYLRPYPTIKVAPGDNVCYELFARGYVAQPSVYFHRDAYILAGGIDSDKKFAMDYDLWVRLARNKCKFVALNEDISANRWYETTKTASQLLSLLAEVISVQIKEYGRVAPYFVQAVSDYIFNKIHTKQRNPTHQLLYRIIYFKALWICLNIHKPFYCLCGLFTKNIAMTSPIIGDKLTLTRMFNYIITAIKSKILK